MPARAAINLLPRSEFDLSLGGKFLKWALTTGRYIIILTEMVVILAFLSRFKLDSDLADLADRIEGKRKVLEALSESELGFRQTQTRLNLVRSLAKSQIDITGLLTQLDVAMPGERLITMSGVTLAEKEVTLTGESASEKNLGALLSNLSMNTRWKGVELSDITTDVLKKTTFSITLKL